MQHMAAEGYGRENIISSQQMKVLGEETRLTPHPRDGITKSVDFTK